MVDALAMNGLASSDEAGAWHLEASCRDLDDSLFFSPEGERGPAKDRRERAAKAICAQCSVQEVCAAYALAQHEPYGTWGGVTETERRQQWRRVDQRTAERRYTQAVAAWARQRQQLRVFSAR